MHLLPCTLALPCNPLSCTPALLCTSTYSVATSVTHSAGSWQPSFTHKQMLRQHSSCFCGLRPGSCCLLVPHGRSRACPPSVAAACPSSFYSVASVAATVGIHSVIACLYIRSASISLGGLHTPSSLCMGTPSSLERMMLVQAIQPFRSSSCVSLLAVCGPPAFV